MRDLETFVNAELTDAGIHGSVNVASGPVMTVAAAFLAGVAVASATVDAYEAGAGSVVKPSM
jgi:hypothetical protein